MPKNSKLINYHIEELKVINNLSERTKKVCLNGSLDNLFKILTYYFKNRSFKQVKNCGDKTNQELIEMSKKYINEYEVSLSDLDLDEDNYLFDKLKFYCYNRYNIKSETSEPYRQYFLLRRFPVFKFISEILKAELTEREYFIFQHNFHFFKNEERMTLQSIGNIYGITRERVRQIALYIPNKLKEILNIFNEELYFASNYYDYKIDSGKNYIIMDEIHANKLNRYEYLDYTQKFYTFAFAELYPGFKPLFLNDNNPHNIYFLINRKIQYKFDFEGFYKTLYDKVNARVEEDYRIDYIELINNHIIDNDERTFKLAKPYCDKLVVKEFGLYHDRDRYLHIKRNTLKKISEYIIEVMEDHKRPLTLQEICDSLKKLKIKVPQNIESLRSSILSIDDVTAIGKTSTYALKSWNKVKTGTIKQLVYEFVKKSDEPIHISEITNYVNQFRKTTNKNILSNLKLDKTNTFIFFRKGFVGLAEKDYLRTSKLLPQLKRL
jgi:hypothetical protein